MKSYDEAVGMEAAEWLLRFIRPDPEDPYAAPGVRDAAFREWLGQSLTHRRVFRDTLEVHRQLKHLDPRRRINIDALTAALRDTEEPTRTASTRRRAPRVAGSIAACAVVALITLPLVRVAPSFPDHYVTAVGEQRRVTLEDGSWVILNTDSELAVSFGAQARSVRLVRGEALFTVAHDAKRPFRLTLGPVLVHDIGTQFDAFSLGDRDGVTVLEGEVQVECECGQTGTGAAPGGTVPFFVQLMRGGQVTMTPSPHGPTISEHVLEGTRIDDVTAWRQGRLVIDDGTLAQLVDQLNRYYPQKLRIKDPSISQLPASGSWAIGNFDRTTHSLESGLNIRAIPPSAGHPNDDVWLVSRSPNRDGR